MKYLEINGVKLKDLNFQEHMVPFFTQQIFLKLLEGGSRSATSMIINFVDTYDSWIVEHKGSKAKHTTLNEDNYYSILDQITVVIMDAMIMRGTEGLRESLYTVTSIISATHK